MNTHNIAGGDYSEDRATPSQFHVIPIRHGLVIGLKVLKSQGFTVFTQN